MAAVLAAGCFAWLPWRRVWYLARIEEIRDKGLEVEVLVHVHGEPLTKDKWLPMRHDGTPAVGTPSLRLLQVLPTALTAVGSLPAVGDRVQLLVIDQELVQLIASQQTDEDPSTVEVPTLVGTVAKVLPARDASLVDVVYPAEFSTEPNIGEAQLRQVQIGNGYVGQLPSDDIYSQLAHLRIAVSQITVISESRFIFLQQQLVHAVRATAPDAH
ncbi:unnamed protein product [Phytophthora lilii]|uniref:Unnamed protein product n=1 Tax=Phytophthora lilii TaxID=2077276 RepID=A0A9W6UCE2_9STRA|nr:unnamed protein product [Phytophthora lilii]